MTMCPLLTTVNSAAVNTEVFFIWMFSLDVMSQSGTAIFSFLRNLVFHWLHQVWTNRIQSHPQHRKVPPSMSVQLLNNGHLDPCVVVHHFGLHFSN